MTDEKFFEELFSNYNPTMKSDDVFMDTLSKKLAAIEFVKQYYEEEMRRCKMFMLVSLVCGIIIGVGFGMWIVSLPDNVPLFTFGIQSEVLLFVERNSKIFSIVFLSVILCYLYYFLYGIYQSFTHNYDYALKYSKQQ